MAAEIRGNQRGIALDGPETAPGDITGLFAGAEVVVRARGIETASLRRPIIEDESWSVGGGSHDTIDGAAYANISVPFVTYLEGLGDGVAPDGIQAERNGLTVCLSGALQSAPDLTTGSTVDGTPTTTSVPEADAGNHALTNSPIGLALFELNDGSRVVRPYTYGSPNHALKFALPSVPDVGNEIHGAAVVPYVWRWTGDAGYSVAAQIANADGGADTDFTVRGMFGTFEIPAVASDAVPSANWSWQAHGFDELADLDVDEAPDYVPEIMAGAEILIGAYGSTAYSEYCVESIGFNLNGAYIFSKCTRRGNSFGVSGFVRGPGVPELKVVLKPGAAPPAAIASAAARFRTSQGAKGDRYHLQASWQNGGPGRVFASYFPKLVLADWMIVDVGGLEKHELTFRASTGRTATEPMCVFGQM